jgi:hypothetical protein
MATEKTTPVSDELLRRISAANVAWYEARNAGKNRHPEECELTRACAQLPSPPPLDPVEECAAAFGGPIPGDQANYGFYDVPRARMAHALRRYRELGCPELK